MTFLDRSISWQQKHSLEPMRRIARRALRRFYCASFPLITIYTSTCRLSQRKLSICAILSALTWSARTISRPHVSHKSTCGTQKPFFVPQKKTPPAQCERGIALFVRACQSYSAYAARPLRSVVRSSHQHQHRAIFARREKCLYPRCRLQRLLSCAVKP